MRLLLAEDEKELSRAVCAILEHSGYQVDAAYDGEEALGFVNNNSYDIMVFDIMMPKMDGIEVLQHIRENGDFTPVILLTAKTEIEDRVRGLDSGADDYLTKPFAMNELLARVRSITRRKKNYSASVLKIGSVTLDTEKQELCSENSVRLAGKETKLMEYLMQNFGKKLSTETIFNRVWVDEENVTPTIVWMYICFLQKKLYAINADIKINGEENGSFEIEKVKKDD